MEILLEMVINVTGIENVVMEYLLPLIHLVVELEF
jgi:hypothetical protein